MKVRKKVARKKKTARRRQARPARQAASQAEPGDDEFELLSSVGGRPPVKITEAEVEKLARLGCTDPDMAYWFGCSVRTIARRRADGGLTAAVWQRGRSGAHVGGRPRNPGPRQVIGSHTLLDAGGPWRKHPETSS